MAEEKEQEINNGDSDIVFLPIETTMKPAPEYTEIFERFKRKHNFVKNIMSSAALDEKYPLTVRKTEDGYDILCGVGRYNAALNQHEVASKFGDSTILLPCKIVDLKEEEALLFIIRDNFEVCRTITGFSEYQFYWLGRLLQHGTPENPTKKELIERVTWELNFSKTKFDQFEYITEVFLSRGEKRLKIEEEENENSNYDGAEEEED